MVRLSDNLQTGRSNLGSVRLAGRVGLGAEVGGGGAGLGEVAGEDGMEEGAEDDLGATSGCELFGY